MKCLNEQWRASHLAQRLTEFSGACRRKGLAVTPQRRAIFRRLLASPEHPSAEEIFAQVRREQPSISLATVHRTLETFCAIGTAQKVTPLHTRARYDGNLDAHHHLVCVGCGRVRDVEGPEFANLLGRRSNLGGFALLGYAVEIRALCKRCKAKSRRRAAAV